MIILRPVLKVEYFEWFLDFMNFTLHLFLKDTIFQGTP